jgi:hypothetical protein
MPRIIHSKMRISLAVMGIAALVLLSIAWADNASTAGGNTSATAATWTPGGHLPGVPLARSTNLSARGVQAAVAISSGIDAQSIREVVSGGAFGLRLRLITARGPNRAPCVSFITESGGAGQFSCFDSSSGEGALVRFAFSGGSIVNKTDWTTLVGLARSDVSRVTMLTQNGNERSLALNRWRGFTYSAASASDFPAALRAYGADGSLIDELQTLP